MQRCRGTGGHTTEANRPVDLEGPGITAVAGGEVQA